jgi:6-pyruvoyltetrahydropterin/6-carboxytetrahydropterin synthase
MKEVLLTKKSGFKASHGHGGDLSEYEHSHDFVYEVSFKGKLNSQGYLLDFREIDHVLHSEVDSVFNDKNLNGILADPTTENIAIWIFDRMKIIYPDFIYSVCVWETENSGITYFG